MTRLLRSCAALTAAIAAALTATLAPMGPAAARSIGGPYTATDRWLPEGEERAFFITFKANEVAWVEATADGDVDLEIYDAAGNLVALDDSLRHDALCAWTPERTQTYTIVVSNYEEMPVIFHMETN
jgi:hypothetical protein